MGYNTDYVLEVGPPNYPIEALGEALARATASGDVADDTAFVRALVGGAQRMKWYDHDADMVALSKQLPNVLFRLHGVGEEHDDEWVKFYFNGEIESHTRQSWSPPNRPSEGFGWKSDPYRSRATLEAVEYRERKPAEVEDARPDHDELDFMHSEIHRLASELGVKVTIKGEST